MSIYSSVNQDHLKTLAQKNKNNPMVLITWNIFVTVLNMLFTFPFIVSFSFLQVCGSGLFFVFFCPCVNFNDKCQKKLFF